MGQDNKLIEVTKAELSKVEDNMMNEKQLSFILKKTPSNHVYQRKAKGGGTWNYVTGTYVKKVLNLVFGWDWSFEVVEHKVDLQVGQAYVLGKLTVRSQGREIQKMQFGRVDIKFRRQSDHDKSKGIPRQPLDVGNDLKAATTDALKKCAAELGIASDVYAPNEFKEIKILPSEEDLSPDMKYDKISDLMDTEGIMISEEDRMNIERILEQKEELSYDKAIKLLKSKLPKNG